MFKYAYFANSTFATNRSNGVVILMFSRFPGTVLTGCPKDSTTEASSVKSSEQGCLDAFESKS